MGGELTVPDCRPLVSLSPVLSLDGEVLVLGAWGALQQKSGIWRDVAWGCFTFRESDTFRMPKIPEAPRFSGVCAEREAVFEFMVGETAQMQPALPSQEFILSGTSLVVQRLCSQCRGPRFDPWLEN